MSEFMETELPDEEACPWCSHTVRLRGGRLICHQDRSAGECPTGGQTPAAAFTMAVTLATWSGRE